MSVIIPKIKTASARVDGDRVIIDLGGGRLESVPWDAAKSIAQMIHQAALQAETNAKAENIAKDQALLMRIGANIGLSSDTKVLDEAKKLAATDKDLRRLPTIESRSVVGSPSIHMSARK